MIFAIFKTRQQTGMDSSYATAQQTLALDHPILAKDRHSVPAAASDANFLATANATRGQRRLALSAIVVSVAIFLMCTPFAKLRLPAIPAFISTYETALIINDLITAVLLFGQFRILRTRAMCLLGCGYLFTALTALIHMLSFPDLFVPGGWLGSGPQSTAWLYMLWHGGFPLFVIGYARLSDARGEQRETNGYAAGAIACTFLLIALGGLAATVGHEFLPAIMDGSHYTPLMLSVISSVLLLTAAALIILWRREQRTVLDLWLIVVMCAWLIDIALSAALNAGRFDLGFYAGRLYGLLAASFLLMLLLVEQGVLYARLAATSVELRRLMSVDSLTGIANRRSFDDTLAVEWRRALRQQQPLSLLLIDVDHFKRYNDKHGHVAGDACLRTVASLIAGCTRRAGDLAARYGGEEFAVVLPNTNSNEACRLAQKICDTVRASQLPHGDSPTLDVVTVSIGVVTNDQSIVPVIGSSLALIGRADAALYRAKATGRNHVAI
jgi:diguanylate cyclase (GGDEF)-like protein